jgi:hypothetical protein
MEIHAVGIDLGKTLFHLVGVDSSGSVVVRKRCSRSQLLALSEEQYGSVSVSRSTSEFEPTQNFIREATRVLSSLSRHFRYREYGGEYMNTKLWTIRAVILVVGPCLSSAQNQAVSDGTSVGTSASPTERWFVRVSPKASLAVGAQRKQQVGGTLNFAYDRNPDGTTGVHQRLKWDINLDNTLTEKPGSSVRTHEYDADLSHLTYFSRHLYALEVAEGFHNSSLNLYLQQSYGAGVGYSSSFQDGRQALELTTDARRIAERFIGGKPGVTFAALRISGEYNLKIGDLAKTPIQLIVAARYIPALTETGAWQARGRATLLMPISKSFSFTTSIIDDYLENTPRKNYSSSSVGITYTFTQP